jgi:hypothetical protein
MELPRERIGPYTRALRAGVDALAPNDDHVPLPRTVAHLEALDPELSGDLLLPAEVDDRSGLPAFVWMERALAEQAVARGGDPLPDDGELGRAAALDPALAARMRARAALHTHLRAHELLSPSRLVVQALRLDREEAYRASYDCLSPTGVWVRIRTDLHGPHGWASGLLAVRDDGSVFADPGLRHLFARHAATPLLAMTSQLGAGTGARVARLSRGALGPFWFPGFPLPDGVPAALGRGLALHLTAEVVGDDVHTSAHRDPLIPPDPDERPPAGVGIYRERRLAVSAGLIGAARAWAADRGCDVPVVRLEPRR